MYMCTKKMNVTARNFISNEQLQISENAHFAYPDTVITIVLYMWTVLEMLFKKGKSQSGKQSVPHDPSELSSFEQVCTTAFDPFG